MLCISLTVINRQYILKYKAFDYKMETSLKLHHASNPTYQVFKVAPLAASFALLCEKSLFKKSV